MVWSMVGDGSVGPPLAQKRSFQLFREQLMRRPDQGLALGPGVGGLRGQNRGHGAGSAVLLGERLAVASGQGGRMCLGAMAPRLAK